MPIMQTALEITMIGAISVDYRVTIVLPNIFFALETDMGRKNAVRLESCEQPVVENKTVTPRNFTV